MKKLFLLYLVTSLLFGCVKDKAYTSGNDIIVPPEEVIHRKTIVITLIFNLSQENATYADQFGYRWDSSKWYLCALHDTVKLSLTKEWYAPVEDSLYLFQIDCKYRVWLENDIFEIQDQFLTYTSGIWNIK